MEFNQISVKQLRTQFDTNNCNITKGPGIYRWWFPKETALELLSGITGIKTEQIIKEQINGNEFWCLYFGISKNLKKRIRWHIKQHHTHSVVHSGFLSTLRQTISAVLQIDQTKSEEDVNRTLDLCYWDYYATASHTDAKNYETEQLQRNYYPLNIQNNKQVCTSVLKQLRSLRKAHKK